MGRGAVKAVTDMTRLLHSGTLYCSYGYMHKVKPTDQPIPMGSTN